MEPAVLMVSGPPPEWFCPAYIQRGFYLMWGNLEHPFHQYIVGEKMPSITTHTIEYKAELG